MEDDDDEKCLGYRRGAVETDNLAHGCLLDLRMSDDARIRHDDMVKAAKREIKTRVLPVVAAGFINKNTVRSRVTLARITALCIKAEGRSCNTMHREFQFSRYQMYAIQDPLPILTGSGSSVAFI